MYWDWISLGNKFGVFEFERIILCIWCYLIIYMMLVFELVRLFYNK